MHQSWKINSTIQTYTSYVQMTRLIKTTTRKRENNEMKCLSVCLKVQYTQTNKEKKNANNAHKYDCSSPKNEQQQEKKKVKKR